MSRGFPFIKNFAEMSDSEVPSRNFSCQEAVLLFAERVQNDEESSCQVQEFSVLYQVQKSVFLFPEGFESLQKFPVPAEETAYLKKASAEVSAVQKSSNTPATDEAHKNIFSAGLVLFHSKRDNYALRC